MESENNSEQTNIFLFTRDLRLYDNSSFLECLKNSKTVYPIFVFNNEQVGSKNPYRSQRCIKFMIESLIDLKEQSQNKISFFKGDLYLILKKLTNENSIDNVYMTADYTPYSKERAQKIKKIIDLFQIEDHLLHNIGKVKKKDGEPYSKFTPYYNEARKFPIKIPNTSKITFEKLHKIQKNAYSIKIHDMMNDFKNIQNNAISGGRKEALKVLSQIKIFENYEADRDFPINNTTMLAAYNKFGCVSIREVYHKVKSYPILTRQLYWRDFYTQIGFFFPRVFKGSMREKYDKLQWTENEEIFNLWKNGQTGIPIIDASMRQLNQTGFLPNRCRMIVADFLIKYLHVNWQKGEEFFAQKLIDYDPCVNNGSWQFHAATGVDCQPFFRIFNPILQSKKFDKDCKYIRKWIPEVKDFTNKEIHNLEKTYIPLIVKDLNTEKEKAIKLYSKIK